MRMIRRFSLGLAAMMAAAAAPAGAQAPAPLELTGYVMLEKVTVDAAGVRTVERVDPQVIVPGDKLIFGTRFANTGAAPIDRFVVSNPVPAAVSVSGEIDPGLLVSVDKGQTWGVLAQLTIAQADGHPRAAMPQDITHVRWILPQIAPGESSTLEFPVTVR